MNARHAGLKGILRHQKLPNRLTSEYCGEGKREIPNGGKLIGWPASQVLIQTSFENPTGNAAFLDGLVKGIIPALPFDKLTKVA